MRKSHREQPYKVQMPGSRWKDIGGQRFGRLIALEPTGEKRHGQHVWLCRCDCGNLKCIPIGQLNAKSGKTQSCGCLLKEARSNFRHGMTDTPIHTRWWGVIQRCYYPNSISYPRYGAKGIRVCDRWLTFENFYADMGEPPTPDAQLDRLDPKGDYCPENCQWLSQRENTRKAARQRRRALGKPIPPYLLEGEL